MAENRTEALRKQLENIRQEALGDDCAGYLIDTFLRACQEAGLEFVVKAAKLPYNPYPNPFSNLFLGWECACHTFDGLGWHKTDPIEVKEDDSLRVTARG